MPWTRNAASERQRKFSSHPAHKGKKPTGGSVSTNPSGRRSMTTRLPAGASICWGVLTTPVHYFGGIAGPDLGYRWPNGKVTVYGFPSFSVSLIPRGRLRRLGKLTPLRQTADSTQ